MTDAKAAASAATGAHSAPTQYVTSNGFSRPIHAHAHAHNHHSTTVATAADSDGEDDPRLPLVLPTRSAAVRGARGGIVGSTGRGGARRQLRYAPVTAAHGGGGGGGGAGTAAAPMLPLSMPSTPPASAHATISMPATAAAPQSFFAPMTPSAPSPTDSQLAALLGGLLEANKQSTANQQMLSQQIAEQQRQAHLAAQQFAAQLAEQHRQHAAAMAAVNAKLVEMEEKGAAAQQRAVNVYVSRSPKSTRRAESPPASPLPSSFSAAMTPPARVALSTPVAPKKPARKVVASPAATAVDSKHSASPNPRAVSFAADPINAPIPMMSLESGEDDEDAKEDILRITKQMSVADADFKAFTDKIRISRDHKMSMEAAVTAAAGDYQAAKDSYASYTVLIKQDQSESTIAAYHAAYAAIKPTADQLTKLTALKDKAVKEYETLHTAFVIAQKAYLAKSASLRAELASCQS